jgi:hypothetical protein
MTARRHVRAVVRELPVVDARSEAGVGGVGQLHGINEGGEDVREMRRATLMLVALCWPDRRDAPVFAS